ncbi:OmpW/AlkL family protein [Celerinatantimonas sp. YJH-8]|uniref:OmpW/AlkL family protein n=1 Tax=Celerinatantimonas sp. YJH-8 TaxID=3228714 RepID=UPI0038C2C222
MRRKIGLWRWILCGLLMGQANAQSYPDNWLVHGTLTGVLVDSSVSSSMLAGHAHVGAQLTPGMGISYFFTPHWAVEFTPGLADYQVSWKRGGRETSMGKVWAFSPILALQYHFMPERSLHPYIGVGPSYIHFFDVNPSAGYRIDYRNRWGYALQAGAEYQISSRWSANFDVKRVSAQAALVNHIGSVAIPAKGNITLWLIGVGIGYRF